MSTKSSTHRLGFVDQLRGLAVIVMIEVHTFNEWIHPDLKQLDIWRALTFINGMVAPSFIMLAGFSLGLAATRKWDEYTRIGLPLWRRIRHLLLILAVGYLLHIPARSYRHWKYWPVPSKIAEFQAVDVLQLIVVSLLILHAIMYLTRSRKALYWGSLVLGTAAFTLTPWAWHTAAFDGLPLWLSNYFNKTGHSLFPMFPWSGFVFFGAFLALMYGEWQKTNNGARFLQYMAMFGAVLVAVALISDAIPVTLQPHYEFWRSSPQFSFLRLGIVMMLLYILFLLESRYGFAPGPVRLMGQESFLVYAFHLIVLYSMIGDRSLAMVWKGQLNFFQASLGYLAFLVPNFAIGYAWHAVKSRSMTAARWIMVAIAAAALFLFFFFENGDIVLWILNPNDPFK